MRVSAFVLLAIVAQASDARAQEQQNVTVVEVPRSTTTWGLYTGRTLGSGGGAIIVDAGWPGFIVGVLFGLTPGFDLGVKIAANYTGVSNYAVNGLTPAYGMDFRITTRISIFESKEVAILASVEPGWHIPEFVPALTSGPSIIFSVGAGIRLVKDAALYLGIDVPAYFQLMPNTRVSTFVSVLPGVGFEYHLLPTIAVGTRVNAGPLVFVTEPTATTSTTGVDFDIVGQAYFFYRWRGTK